MTDFKSMPTKMPQLEDFPGYTSIHVKYQQEIDLLKTELGHAMEYGDNLTQWNSELKTELEKYKLIAEEAESATVFQEGVIRRLEEDKKRLTKSNENYKEQVKTHNSTADHLRLGWEQDKTMLKAKVVQTYKEGLRNQGINDEDVLNLKTKDWCNINRI